MQQRRMQGRRLVQLRSMLDDPQFSFREIGEKLGFTKQRISQLAKELGINGRQRQRKRISIHVIAEDYSPEVQAVIKQIERAGMQVLPYNSPQPSQKNYLRRSKRMVLVNGVLCTIQLREVRKYGPYGHEYARFGVGSRTKQAKAAVLVVQKARSKKLYVVPTALLRKTAYVYIPANGKYAVGMGKKPRRDWTRYENAWHLLDKR